jgi:hypothetical protein
MTSLLLAVHLCDEAVASAWEGFHVSRLLGMVGQGSANLVNREINSMFKIDESRILPEAAPDFFTGN